MSKRSTYCWDTNIILAWLSEEKSAPLGDIELVIAEIDRGDAVLLVPVTAYSEVLEARNTPDKMDQFRRFLQRSNVEVANITEAIAVKAGQIQSRGLEATPVRKLKTPDATFMATAIVFKAHVFHTLETAQLPLLSKTTIVDGLYISPPKPLTGAQSLLNPSPTSQQQPS